MRESESGSFGLILVGSLAMGVSGVCFLFAIWAPFGGEWWQWLLTAIFALLVGVYCLEAYEDPNPTRKDQP